MAVDELIRRCQEGNPQAFEEVFNLYKDDVYRFAYLVIRDNALAQDVVQEAFLKVFRSVGNFQHRSSFKSWLYRVAVNESITILRRRKIKEELAPAHEVVSRAASAIQPRSAWQPEEAALENEVRDALRQAIERLDPLHRSVIVLKYYHEFSDTEIANVLGCPQGTVKSRLHRGRELLREDVSRQLGRPTDLPLPIAGVLATPAGD